MKKLCIVITLAMVVLIPALTAQKKNPFAGRWDINVTTEKETYPNWMEVVDKDGSLQVRIQPRGGNVRPAVGARMEGSRLVVTVSGATPARAAAGERAATPARPEVTWELTVKGSKFTGTQKLGDAANAKLAGVRAPALNRAAPKAWTDPQPLFNGKDLTGWEPIANTGLTANHWVAKDGELINEDRGANIKTTRKFNDFKLHVEYNLTAKANSGVYLRGRYEVQVSSAAGRPGSNGGTGSVFGMISPAVAIPAKPDQWQAYDITFVGRNVTVDLNGVRIIDNQEIPGITGGALDSNEGEPGPFYLQGDHTGGVKFRNITISTPKGR